MQAKIEQKNKAIELRKQGLSYTEILQQIPVAKSSLSLWLKSDKLAKSQRQGLTAKKLAGMKRGWESCHRKRVLLTEEIKNTAEKEIDNLTKRELWLIGTALYWGEGNKEKEGRPGSGVKFSNSDPRMIKIFLKWLFEIIQEKREKIYLEIYIHENYKNRLNQVIGYWSDCTGFAKNNFIHIYFKKNKINTKRKNIGKNYYGLLRVGVKSSSILQRKIEGWIDGIYKHCGIV